MSELLFSYVVIKVKFHMAGEMCGHGRPHSPLSTLHSQLISLKNSGEGKVDRGQ